MELRETISYYLLACKADGCKPATLETYQYRLRRLKLQLGDRAIESVTIKDLRMYVASLYDEKLSRYTVNGLIRTLRSFFSWVFFEEMIDSNPALRIKRPSLPKTPPKAIQVIDIQRMLDAARSLKCEWESIRNVAILKFLTDTGCRLQGLAELKVGEMDFKMRRGKVFEKDNDWRFVFLKSPTINAIESWLEIRSKVVRNESIQSLWIAKGGAPLTSSGIQTLFQRLKSRAGITGPASAHAFRHRFAISYLLNGGDLATLADILGHSDIRTTKMYYARFSIGELQEKHDRHSPIDQVE